MKPKALLVAGPPASGKSTLAKEFVESGYFELNRDFIRFNTLRLGTGWHDYEFTGVNERLVTKQWNHFFESVTKQKADLVISDTLCKAKDRRRIAKKLTEVGYDVIIVILNPPLEVLIERDGKRGNYSVGKEVIEAKWRQLNEGL